MGEFGSRDGGVCNFIRENSWLLLKNKVGQLWAFHIHPLIWQPSPERWCAQGSMGGWRSQDSTPVFWLQNLYPFHAIITFLHTRMSAPSSENLLLSVVFLSYSWVLATAQRSAWGRMLCLGQRQGFGDRLPISTSSSRAALWCLLPIWTAREPEAHLKVEGIFGSLLRGIHWTTPFLFRLCCEIPSPSPQKYGYVCSQTSEGPASWACHSEHQSWAPPLLVVGYGSPTWYPTWISPALIRSQATVAPSSHSPALLTCLSLSTAHQDSCHPWLLPGRCQHGQRICSPKIIFPKILFFSCRATFHPKCFLSITSFLTVYYEVMLGVIGSTWRKWGTESFGGLGRTSQLVSSRASPWIQFPWQTIKGSCVVALVRPRAGRNFTTSSHPPMLADLALLGLPE